MDDPVKPPFLRLTFDGGRFLGHSLPVEVLAEFAALQELIHSIAADLYRSQHSKRRVPPGFHEAAKLHLVSTEHNCFTANLVRPSEQRWPSLTNAEKDIFEQARELAIKSIARGVGNEDLPRELPDAAANLLLTVGRKLSGDEGLVVSASADAEDAATSAIDLRARVDLHGRANIVAVVNRRNVAVSQRFVEVQDSLEDIEGEVFRLDDATSSCSLHLGGSAKVEVNFLSIHRAQLVQGLALRPIRRFKIALDTFGDHSSAMGVIKSLKPMDHPRAPDVEKTWDRLLMLSGIKDGWLDGQGLEPTEVAVVAARGVLARLMVSFPDIDRPRVFPNPDGGIQAEWVIGNWAADVAFDPKDGSVLAEATNADTGEEREVPFDTNDVTADDASYLGWWLLALTAEGNHRGR